MTEHISQFFAYEHLREPLRAMSARFAMAHDAVLSKPDRGAEALKQLRSTLEIVLPKNPESDVCLRKVHVACNPGLDFAAQYDEQIERDLVLRMLLEAKDCAVRALLAKDANEGICSKCGRPMVFSTFRNAWECSPCREPTPAIAHSGNA